MYYPILLFHAVSQGMHEDLVRDRCRSYVRILMLYMDFHKCIFDELVLCRDHNPRSFWGRQEFKNLLFAQFVWPKYAGMLSSYLDFLING